MYYDDTLAPDGLYTPAFEHDACGVGLVCTLTNNPSHGIVQKGLRVLENLSHRGATGCDPRTGDGAGLLLQVPHAFLARKAEAHGIDLPAAGHYGVGMLFLPPDAAEREHCQTIVEEVVRAEGQHVLGWRAVPTDNTELGVTARRREPSVWQLFVGRDAATDAGQPFERALYVIRKVIAHRVAATDLAQKAQFYVSSLSARTVVYKGMLTADQVRAYYPDLSDPALTSALALCHSRFSTNTLPQWALAQPFRFLCHNGEINTLRGNANWLNAREPLFTSDRFGTDLQKLLPLLRPGMSDSAVLDTALELLYFTGRSLPHAIMMLIPEAWEHDEAMDDARRAFYEYHACLIEPWDGPVTLPFTDGRYVGAVLDRNGLRPSRYTITDDGLVVLASETGVLDLNPAAVREKGRLQPGRMFLVDLQEHRRVPDDEIKAQVSRRQPYREWLDRELVTLSDLPAAEAPPAETDDRTLRQHLFGYTLEDLKLLVGPMAENGKDPLGSMGDDAPLAVLSDRPQLLYDYFRQLFAQVTNPPLDAIREELVTSLYSHMGPEHDLFQEEPGHCHQLRLDHPILTDDDLARIRTAGDDRLQVATLPMLFDVDRGGEGLREGLERLCRAAERAVDDGHALLVLSDRETSAERAPIPALLATGAVHHHLIRTRRRMRCSLIVESGEPRTVHHFCLLLGYGAGAVNPYLALDTIGELVASGLLNGTPTPTAVANYLEAASQGILKVMSKMGISTLQSYRGAQIFEAVGLSQDVVAAYFDGTPSRLDGVGLDVLATEVRQRHERAYPPVDLGEERPLDPGGRFHWRRGGEHHVLNPNTVGRLQHAARYRDADTYDEYAALINEQSRALGTLRGLLSFTEDARPVPINEVEPWTEIVKRFKTGAMSYGSLSEEAHQTLAAAMNQIGGKSNTGEGGEHPDRYAPESPYRSRIKQVASGRFGVTSAYLTSADEIQIKMAQGAKPGEGGQLPGKKVYPWIAEVRHSTPHVGLISPPPHHDIYSIEDLAQLIYDLKNANPEARISVKLVSEVGVGTIAAGVAKGKADLILISGHDGGTGASPRTSLVHAGLPWELGLAETNQSLVRQGLRRRVRLECDGQLRTGRDVAVAALLGADEFGFATAPLVAMGCIMMRKCHLNTCPVGIATQNPELRKKFTGTPEHVVNYFYFVANELRAIMARLGFRTVEAMVGRVDRLVRCQGSDHWKARHLDLSPILARPETPSFLKPFVTDGQDHGLEAVRDRALIEEAAPALERGEPIALDCAIRNTERALGTMLSHAVSRRHGPDGLPEDTITLRCTGSAGQSFMAFGAPGLTAVLEGDANDYFGKGLSGATLAVRPPRTAHFAAEEQIIVGNVALYGATAGRAFVRGQAGERFAVRNSGVHAVVEGVGDHGCEYMTGGRVVVLGPTGRNFAAGMSGGIAYVLDPDGTFPARCNMGMVELTALDDEAEAEAVRALVEHHATATESPVARRVLDDWDATRPQFVRVMPTEYRKALEAQRAAEEPTGLAA